MVKFAVKEPESGALESWVARQGVEVVISDLVQTETLRFIRRMAADRIGEMQRQLASLPSVRMTSAIFARAAMLEPLQLRSLDALHLASALSIGDELEGVITYDRRLAESCETYGVPVVAPV